MAQSTQLKNANLLAVWPGMGDVAIRAGRYLVARLGMKVIAEFPPPDQLELNHIDIVSGLVRPGSIPRGRVYGWSDPRGKNDLVVFVGDAHPRQGSFTFCRRLVDFCTGFGVERIFTFASMPTATTPDQDHPIHAIAIDPRTLASLKQLEIPTLEKARISGLNGVLLTAAVEKNLPGACLLGEIPEDYAQLGCPKASAKVLRAFTTLLDIELDFGGLESEVDLVEKKLKKWMTTLRALGQDSAWDTPEGPAPTPKKELKPADRARIEELFRRAEQDREHPYELKRELDRCGAFTEFESRFLDLFTEQE